LLKQNKKNAANDFRNFLILKIYSVGTAKRNASYARPSVIQCIRDIAFFGNVTSEARMDTKRLSCAKC